jgi:hypothetical protein
VNAEQYRALVAKLEAINPSEPVNEAPEVATTDPTALEPTGSKEVIPADALKGPVDPDKYKPNDNIPEIKAGSLSQAKQIALKQLGPGKKFRFCMTYGTNLGPAKPPGDVRPMPSPPDNFSQLGGANVVKPVQTYSGIRGPAPGKQ